MWNYKDKIIELPLGIEYSYNTKELDLTYTNVDMIPRGLKGVEQIKMLKVPKYVAPDFHGDILVSKGSDSFEKIIPIEIYKAKFSYRQDPTFVESLRYVGGSSMEIAVLPQNIRFFEKNGKTYLDLTKTKISQRPEIVGVDEIIMPRRGLFHRKSQQITYQKIKTYE